MLKKLKYGKEEIGFEFPENTDFLCAKEPEYDIDKLRFVEEFKSFLPESPQAYKKVALVVSDKTRLCNYPVYLPWITEVLESFGANAQNIVFFIAYGTHPKQTENESISCYGDTYSKYKFVHHDCSVENELISIGTTKRGTDIKVRKEIMESSLLITFGAISHHYFAGFGGGRKLIFPGLSGKESIYKNHSYFLNHDTETLEENCQPGRLQGNPIAEDLKEIDALLPHKISIHGILDSKGQVCRLLVSNTYEGFIHACKIHDSYYRSGTSEKYDLVIASSGGYPKDINFIQGHKSVHHAAAFVKDGGNLVILSECIDGIGSQFFTKYLEMGSFESAFKVLKNNYEGNGGTALSMLSKTSRINIHMLTKLNQEDCKVLKVKLVSQVEIQSLIQYEKNKIAVIENASLLIY